MKVWTSAPSCQPHFIIRNRHYVGSAASARLPSQDRPSCNLGLDFVLQIVDHLTWMTAGCDFHLIRCSLSPSALLSFNTHLISHHSFRIHAPSVPEWMSRSPTWSVALKEQFGNGNSDKHDVALFRGAVSFCFWCWSVLDRYIILCRLMEECVCI